MEIKEGNGTTVPRFSASSVRAMHQSRFLAPVLLCLILAAGSIPPILGGFDRGRGANDQNRFHLRVIREFAREWPHLNFRSYVSATTPGFHVVVAAAARYVSGDLRVLRLVGLLFTVGLIATLGAALSRRVGTGVAVALGLPLICSLYVYSSGVWLLPDNAAWWGTLAILLVALDWRDDTAHFLAAAILLPLVILMRQPDIWTAGVLWIAVWLGPREANVRSDRRRQLGLILLCTVPGAVDAHLLRHAMAWTGTPSVSTPWHAARRLGDQSLSARARAGASGRARPVLPGCADPAACPQVSDRQAPLRFIAAGVLSGAVIGLLPRTTYDYAHGRFGGIWNLVRHLPLIGDRSPLIVALAGLGGGILTIFCLALERRERVIWPVALFLLIAAQFVNGSVWQRYFEPFILMFLALATAQSCDAESRERCGGWEIAAGPILLSLIQAGLTIAILR